MTRLPFAVAGGLNSDEKVCDISTFVIYVTLSNAFIILWVKTKNDLGVINFKSETNLINSIIKLLRQCLLIFYSNSCCGVYFLKKKFCWQFKKLLTVITNKQ